MDALFQELLRTLTEARNAVQAELEMRRGADLRGRAGLERLLRSAVEFAGQAESLVVMMQDRDGDEAVIQEAEELCELFEETQDQALALLGRPFG